MCKERSYAEARRVLELLRDMIGAEPDIVYGTAACDYQLNDYKSVVDACTDVVSSAAKRHPGHSPTHHVSLKNERKTYLYSAFLAKEVHSKRSGMYHTVLPANDTVSAFSS